MVFTLLFRCLNSCNRQYRYRIRYGQTYSIISAEISHLGIFHWGWVNLLTTIFDFDICLFWCVFTSIKTVFALLFRWWNSCNRQYRYRRWQMQKYSMISTKISEIHRLQWWSVNSLTTIFDFDINCTDLWILLSLTEWCDFLFLAIGVAPIEKVDLLTARFWWYFEYVGTFYSVTQCTYLVLNCTRKTSFSKWLGVRKKQGVTSSLVYPQ